MKEEFRPRLSPDEYQIIKDYRNGVKQVVKQSKKSVKILLFDIETIGIQAMTWGLWKQNVNTEFIFSDWFMLSWAAKWLDEDNVFSSILTPDEIINHDDHRITTNLWGVLDEADVVIAHNCVEVNTPILKTDLTWVKAGDLKVGDELVGFEEKTPPEATCRRKNKWVGVNGRERKVLPTKITSFDKEMKHCFKVVFDNGDSVICTDDHYWLGMAEKDNNQRWYKTESLRVGQRVNKFLTPWDVDKSYEAGWLSGFISGEGTLKGVNADGKSCVNSIDFCQRPTVVLDQALKYCDDLNIKLSELKQKKGGLGRGDTLYTYTLGGKWKTIEILGKLQISRLIENINWNRFGGLNGIDSENGVKKTLTIVSIEDVGIQEVAVISTTEKTYIANGFPMHNCDKFDKKKVNTRFLFHQLPPPSHYDTFDTLKQLRENFAITSNRLDYVNKWLGLEGKIKTEASLWMRCIKGEQEALTEMETYNKEDVMALERNYLRIRGWSKDHPNVNLFDDSGIVKCPNCGSENLEWNGYKTTKVSRYKAYTCSDCGHIGHSRYSDMTKEERKLIVR